jgi:hypothetical protein
VSKIVRRLWQVEAISESASNANNRNHLLQRMKLVAGRVRNASGVTPKLRAPDDFAMTRRCDATRHAAVLAKETFGMTM